MIQRIQTIWLSLVTLLSAILCSGSIIRFIDSSGTYYNLGFSGILLIGEKNTELVEKVLPVPILLILIAVQSIIAIILFKKRDVQIMLARIIILFSIILTSLIIFYSFKVFNTFSAELVPGIRMVFPLLIIAFSFLALRGIKKDDRLVKSYDRLR